MEHGNQEAHEQLNSFVSHDNCDYDQRRGYIMLFTMRILHLGYNGCLVPATQLYATCLTLLDLVYLLHEPVYESLLRASIENSTPSQLQG